METGNIWITDKDIVQSLQKCKTSTLNTFVGKIYTDALEVEH